MNAINKLCESLNCTPQIEELDFWEDDKRLQKFLKYVITTNQSHVKYCVQNNKMEALFVYSSTINHEILEEVLSECVECKHFILWGLNIVKLPDSIVKMIKLINLNVSFTQITELPETIGILASLASLDIGSTQITEFPEIIGKLTSLKHLDISSTEITELPESIGQLTSLTSLNIHDTDITELPETINKLVSLTNLDISDTDITELPETIGNLTSLMSLDIGGTDIIELPETIGNLTSLMNLDIGGTDITELPETIGNFSILTNLNIRGTDIAELPKSIGNFFILTSLDIRGTKITELPETISNLTSLTWLNIGRTKITEFPESIGKLSSLTNLDISDTDITELPETISNLTSLAWLNISGTKITKLPKTIGNLTSLTWLSIGDTKITKLPETIGNLTSLTWLDISGTKITKLPMTIYSLPLKNLDLSNLALETLPKEILNFNLPFDTNFAAIHLRNTVVHEIGVEIFKKPIEDIKLFYDELERGKVTLNETRVIFVGNGNAGKSGIIHRLLEGQYPGDEELQVTRGVLIKKWHDNTQNPSQKISFWDFGGQAIMHSMHEFFLSERCIYVLVLDGRSEENPYYWLDIISQYGATSKLMVVMNKIDENNYAEMNLREIERVYEKDFGSNMYFHKTSCKTGEGFENFKNDLIELAQQSETHQKSFPKHWYDIKLKLEALEDKSGNPQNYLRENDFKDICEAEGIIDKRSQDTLLRWMNDLGVCFSYRGSSMEAVNEFKILRPEWITNGVYKLITSKKAEECNGFISHSDIKEILETEDDVNLAYRYTEKEFIIGIMQDFKLSYSSGAFEFIPMLTTVNEPALPIFNNQSLHFIIEYSKPISSQVLYSFMIEVKDDLDKNFTWRSGTLLRCPYYSCTALVRLNHKRDEIGIYVEGEKQTEYFAHIRKKMEIAQGELDIDYKEFIVYKKDGKEHNFSLKRMLSLIKNNARAQDYTDDGEEVRVIEVLSAIAPSHAITALLNNLKSDEDKITSLKIKNESVEEIRHKLFALESNTDFINRKTDQILANQDEIKNIIHQISQKTDQQIETIIATLTDIQIYSKKNFENLENLFKELSSKTLDAYSQNIVNSVLDSLKKGKFATATGGILKFISYSSSTLSLAPHVGNVSNEIFPIIEKIIANFPQELINSILP